LHKIKEEFFPNVPTIIAKRISETPLNEFTQNHTIFLNAFPHLFLFGKKIPYYGTLSKSFIDFLLHQRSGAFVKDKKFLFLVGNQLVRSINIRAVNLKAINKPDKIIEIGQLSVDEEFQKKLNEGMKDPKSKSAKYVLSKFDKLVRSMNNNVPFSSSSKAKYISIIYAMVQIYSCPNTFFTFAMDDKHNTLSLRLCFPTNNGNSSFPAVDDNFLESLATGENQFKKDIDISNKNL
jgi:hypothetical protein